jgi:hypothetical protein
LLSWSYLFQPDEDHKGKDEYISCMYVSLTAEESNKFERNLFSCEDAAKTKTRLQFFSHLAATHFIGQHLIPYKKVVVHGKEENAHS